MRVCAHKEGEENYNMEHFTKRPFLAEAYIVQYKRKCLLTSVSGVAYMPLSASELARVVEVKLETNRKEEKNQCGKTIF